MEKQVAAVYRNFPNYSFLLIVVIINFSNGTGNGTGKVSRTLKIIEKYGRSIGSGGESNVCNPKTSLLKCFIDLFLSSVFRLLLGSDFRNRFGPSETPLSQDIS